MIQAKAIENLVQNGKIVGYTLLDTEGNKMKVKSEAIMDAMTKNAINITNLRINNGTLERTDSKVEKKVEQSVGKSIESGVEKNVESTGNPKMDRMKLLVNKLNEARMVYEQGTDEIMSNYEYDKLYDELLALEKELGTTLTNSPTQNVGYEVVSKLPKESHETPMLSLDKTKDRNALVNWLNGREGVLSWKLDGLTVVLTYMNGTLVKGVTRGNGEIGEVVTPNVKQFINVPRHIAFKGKLVLRGEAVISYSSFNRINSAIVSEDEKYKNPRNLCSGSVRQLDSSITAKRDVQWIAFEIVEAEGVDKINDVAKGFEWLKVQGFTCVEHEVVTPATILDTIEKFSNKVENYDIPSDGLVLTFKDKEYGKSLGRTSKFPRHSIAFKWKDDIAETRLSYIEWQVGRSGIITPVANFEPVDIEGSTVARASLHNLSVMYDTLGQPYVGQRIGVYKANMIIPCVAWGEKLDESEITQPLYIPSLCPCCGCETDIREEDTSGVLTLWCTNPDCDAKGNRLFEHFVSRDAMNIDGISKATLVTLSDVGIISDLPSIFNIEKHMDEIVNLEGFGYKSYCNMVNAINKARNVKLSNLIYALGIPNVGLATAKLICKNFNYDMKSTVTASYGQLINIDGIGDVIAQSFVDYFASKENAEQFVRLLNEVHLIEEKVSEDTSMAGVTICVTGDVHIFPNRRAIKEIVENMGGKLTGSVSRSTSYLVTNDTTSGSAKNKAAQQYNIPILTEQEFIDKFNIEI